jgi:hypothetical protein
MAISTFLDILPDPSHPIGIGGQALATASGGTAGPGFTSVSFSSQAPIQMSRTNSGRVITRSIAGHRWNINITYNPMTREQFEPIYSFLLEKNGKLNPFFIQLPQHVTSRNTAFTTHQASNPIDTHTTLSAGAGFMIQDGHSSTAATQPQPGDMFTITDTNDSLHTKAYRITRVMNGTDSNNALPSAPDSTQRIVYFTPHLQRSVSQANAVIDYTPLIRVMLTSDVQSYSLNTNNLFQFSLKLEEAQA